MTFEGVIAIAGTLAAAVWLMWGINRLSLAWTAVQARVKELDQKRVDMAREMMKFGEVLLRHKRDETEASDKLGVLRGQVAAKTKELSEFVPPPPQEILITSEYPATRDDKAWIVSMVRPNGADAGNPQQYLVWAGDHAAALNRARSTLADQASGYEASNAQRYG
ncbi:MAG: hypothetical protein JO128_09110 [Alphaproteobacteria bacterium]|nr:hypothetical protein [Alphaproteobacteria bacterium]